MCKLLGRIVKLIASMSARRYHPNGNGDDTSRRYRGDVASVPVPRPSRETTGSSSAATPASSVSARGTTYPTSHVRTESAPSRSLSESPLPRDAQERMSMDHDGTDQRKRSVTSSSKDQGSMYSREGEGSKIRDEFRPPREEDQHRYDGDDRQDTTCGRHYPSSKESLDIHRPPLAHSKKVEPIASSSATIQHLYETQSRELGAFQHEHRVALEEKKKYADAYAALKHHYDERSKKLSSARHERQVALDQRNEINVAYVALRQQYEEQTKKLNTVYDEHRAVIEQKQKAEEECAALRQKYEAQKNEHSALNNKHQSLKATLEQCTSELQGVQRFLTTADTFSGSEVVNTLRKLNEEVQQSTTFMAEWAAENFTLETSPTDQTTTQTIEQTRAAETLGMRFMQLLGTKKHKENPILVEMAFRAYLIYELYWIASPWSIGQEEQSHNVYIDAIYQRMREAEGQAISGNWRALTRTHTLPACISDPELAHAIDTTIVSGFSDILLAAGCTASKSDVTSAFWSKFGEKIHDFVSLAGQVNKIIGVGVISEDFEVLVTWPDTVFDDKTMEDSYDNGDRVRGTEQHQETVLFATELGLMQRMRVGAGMAQKGKPSELIVMKPKVALVSVIDIIDE